MANPTYQSILDGARELVKDTDDPNTGSQRFPDSMLIGILNRALSALSTVRPDAFYDSFNRNNLNVPTVVAGTPDEDAGEVGLDDEMAIDRMFHPPLIEYVAGMIEATEDEFTVDGRALLLLERFRRSVTSM